MLDPVTNNHDFIADLNDHQSSVNAVRFSPCGKQLACVSDRQIVVYTSKFVCMMLLFNNIILLLIVSHHVLSINK